MVVLADIGKVFTKALVAHVSAVYSANTLGNTLAELDYLPLPITS